MNRLLREGQKIRGTWEVERYLGEGAFAEVYRVRHRFLGRQAMKVFKHVGTRPETEDLLGEAIMLSQIRHPNIVSVFDADTVSTSAGECGFFTMEYVAGGSLHQFWTSHGDRFVPSVVTVELLCQVCDGLSVAHGEDPPIVHRDITPHNILVGYERDGLRARIGDFGLAKRADRLSGLLSTQGTLVFKAPESLVDVHADSAAGDVWALGTIAYLLLTDVLPYEDPGGAQSFMRAHRRTPPPSPRELNDDVDEALAAVVLQALDPDPRRRMPDARALRTALEPCRAHGSTVRGPKEPGYGSTSKKALGQPTPADRRAAEAMRREALGLARGLGTLPEAADLMEEAFNKDPDLRPRYEPRVKLWRKGVVT